MKAITACTLDCQDTCSLLVEVGSDGTIHIEGNPAHPFTAGFACAKTRRFGRTLRSPNRLTHPLRRAGETWQPIEWDDALALCAERISRYRHEPSSILHVVDPGNKGVLPLLSSLFFARLGASRVSGSLCDSAGIAACEADFGVLDHNDIGDVINARRIVNWGKDLSRSSAHVAVLVRVARGRGAKVLTVSPGGDGNSSFSDDFVRIRPGTDRFLAAAVIRLLMERGAVSERAALRTEHRGAFESLILGRSLDDLGAACGVAARDIERMYSFYVSSEPVATLMGYGLQRYSYGGENVRFINALALLAGHIGRSGGGSYFNISSFRNFNLSWAQHPGDEERRTFYFPTIGRDIMSAASPPVKMIWVNGCNVVNQAPDSKAIARAFAGAEFRLVVDAFMTDTAELADLVLPCALMLEREEVVGSFVHNFVNYAGQVIAPPQGARPDHWILTEVGKRLSPPVVLPAAEDCLRMSLWSPFLDVSLEDLRRAGFVRARRDDIAFSDLTFAHPEGKYRLPQALHEEPAAPPGFPLRLLTVVRREAIHSQILPEDHGPVPTVWVSPECAVFKELDLARDVYLASPLGRLKVAVVAMPDLDALTCLYRRGDWMKLGGGANQLIAQVATDLGQGTAFYDQHVTLEN